MQFSVVNYATVTSLFDFRIDGEYWHPDFIKNDKKVDKNNRIQDFTDQNILNIKSSPINKGFEYLEISKIDLNNGQFQTSTITQGDIPDRAHYILNNGDVAISTVRPNRNAVAFIDENGIVGSSGLAILRAQNIEKEYLFTFCKTEYFIKCLTRANKATMYPAVSSNAIFETPIFLPSIKFRSLIVEKVKQVLTQNYKSKQIYRQSQSIILSELGLTNWQPKHQLTFIKNHSETKQVGRMDAEYYQPKYNAIIKAIQNYSGGWDMLDNLVKIKKCIEVGSEQYLDRGIPFVRVSNIGPFGMTEEKYISEKAYKELTPKEKNMPFEESRNYQPQQDEILLSKDGTPGIAHYLKEQPPKMIPSGGILRLKSKTDKVNNEYLTLALNSILTQEQVNRDVGGSIILHWRPDQVKKTIIPILPETKQLEIQRKITKSFNLRKQSKHLLESAKKAVEIAIEQDEQTAIKWLKNEIR